MVLMHSFLDTFDRDADYQLFFLFIYLIDIAPHNYYLKQFD